MNLVILISSPEPPIVFKEELQSQEIKEGETVTLSCELSKPGIAVQWKKGTVLLKQGRKYEMIQKGCLLQLLIRDLKSEDTGSYKCSAGSLVTTASLVVKGKSFTNVKYDKLKKLGRNLHFFSHVQSNLCSSARTFRVLKPKKARQPSLAVSSQNLKFLPSGEKEQSYYFQDRSMR